MPHDVHVSSLVVHARPDRLAEIEQALAGVADVELHGSSPAGRIVVTLETATEGLVLERLSMIRDLPGVLGASLVFHGIDRDEPSGKGKADELDAP